MKKVFYEKPTTETLVVRFEGVICGSPNRVHSNNQTEYFGRGDDDDVDIL